ncbi:hypothetical protein [Stenotrophomonas maltophilia]|uniref:hypothetical protein n=1 Tax=Stenotrophomonas maltophilia TaxID=40324 RepID=UPI001F36ACA2|nr:hypothetical protein [Stenotrophomonas maltophilia]MCF3470377.1 hypothetical protein [Stenotrophomonas maltophilia]
MESNVSDQAHSDQDSADRPPAPLVEGHPRTHHGYSRSTGAVLGALIMSATLFVTWIVTANNVLGFGIYQNSTVTRLDQIDQNYVKNSVHQAVVSELTAKTNDAKQLQTRLDASTAQAQRLSEQLNSERQNAQARAVACMGLNNRVAQVRSEQVVLERSIAQRYRTNGIFQAPSKDVPLETALESDRRYSMMLQEQILELTRGMRDMCGYPPQPQESGT